MNKEEKTNVKSCEVARKQTSERQKVEKVVESECCVWEISRKRERPALANVVQTKSLIGKFTEL